MITTLDSEFKETILSWTLNVDMHAVFELGLDRVIFLGAGVL